MNWIFHCRRFRFAAPRLPAILALLALLFLAGAPPAVAQESAPSAYAVKAAFLLNFGKFVEWPTNAFATASSPLVIGVFGGDPSHGDLERIVAGQKIAGHPVVVRPVQTPPDLRGCHILFIPASARRREQDAFKAAGNAGALTVGESDGFCEAGGMIAFVIENDQVHFDINNAAARAAGLKISSKLLTLARRLQK